VKGRRNLGMNISWWGFTDEIVVADAKGGVDTFGHMQNVGFSMGPWGKEPKSPH